MRIKHHVRKEDSGLLRASLEFAHFEERIGHDVILQEPSSDNPFYGVDGPVDLHVVHSQFHPCNWRDTAGKVMILHGEPLSSVSNGISMKAICDLAPVCDAFICMRAAEQPIWNLIKRTYTVPKGVDLDRYSPGTPVKKLSGEPAILYCENWRGQRNPLYLIAACALAKRRLPKLRLHLYNCQDAKLHGQIKVYCDAGRLYDVVASLLGPAPDVVDLYRSADIVASCLHPLYARTAVESLACGAAHVAPGYDVTGHDGTPYPYRCDLEPHSMADAIVAAWEARGTFSPRQWAEQNHDAAEMVRQAVAIYERILA